MKEEAKVAEKPEKVAMAGFNSLAMDIARRIAEISFTSKKDKGGHPYIGHLERVAENSLKYIKDKEINHEEVRIIGMLHDLLEDCREWNKERLHKAGFSDNVVNCVLMLTRRAGQRYSDYIRQVAVNDYARAVKLADLEDNMSMSRLLCIGPHDIVRLQRYHDAYRELYARNNVVELRHGDCVQLSTHGGTFQGVWDKSLEVGWGLMSVVDVETEEYYPYSIFFLNQVWDVKVIPYEGTVLERVITTKNNGKA